MPGRPILLSLVAFALLTVLAPPSACGLDLGAYSQFLTQTCGWGSNELLASRAPFGPYYDGAAGVAANPAYLPDIDQWLHLTPGERNILTRQGFVVSERWRSDSFGSAFLTIHARDLPVFVSTDAILHAVHKSYDDLLAITESTYIVGELRRALSMMREEWPRLDERYRQDERMRPNLADADVYLTVAQNLLEPNWFIPSQSGNDELVRQVLAMVRREEPAEIALFSETTRTYDFSQMKPRGHYVGDEHPELEDYFRAMMWLGRTEFRLSPSAGNPDPTREIIDARLLIELARESGARQPLENIDRLLRTLVGPSDNVTMGELDSLFVRLGVESADELMDLVKIEAFRSELASGAYTQQKILSQILYSDLLHPENLRPPYAFLLMGQRFLIDSFVTGDVVWPAVPASDPDRVRLLPDPLDVLYSLGNDDVLPFLRDELDRYLYAPNLAAVRYLVDDQDPSFWSGELYNAWLQAIRTLSKSGRQEAAPAFMRTGAWQQEKMNTQLASWAELRHDNLLYGKQSYTGGISCSFPCTYIEPAPECYHALGLFAEAAAEAFTQVPSGVNNPFGFFRNMKVVMDRLVAISRKELHGDEFTEEEKQFLRAVLYTPERRCEESGNGWYRTLYYMSWVDAENTAQEADALVADVHTDPNTERVLHVATGDPELGIFVAPGADDRPTAFVGPVASYHEYVTSGFKRLTDDEWNQIYDSGAPTRPDWTYVYLADRLGNMREDGRRLATIADSLSQPPPRGEVHTVNDPDDQGPGSAPGIVHLDAVPNPFTDAILIRFRIGGTHAERVHLGIYDAQGRLVCELLDGTQARGFTTVRWRGDDGGGRTAPPGAYYAKLHVGQREAACKLLLVR